MAKSNQTEKAIGIILLFLCVSDAPNISRYVVKAFTEDNLVEITALACAIKKSFFC
jgi:hypothetical protein